MHYFIALICFLAGVSCFGWYRPLYKAYAKFMATRFHQRFGDLATRMKWDDPTYNGQLLNYKFGVIGFGLMLIAVACYLIVGTINIGS
jgi:hypothetical protein